MSWIFLCVIKIFCVFNILKIALSSIYDSKFPLTKKAASTFVYHPKNLINFVDIHSFCHLYAESLL